MGFSRAKGHTDAAGATDATGESTQASAASAAPSASTPTLSRRGLLKATAGGLVVLGAGFAGFDSLVLPQMGGTADRSRIYDYVYGGAKSEAFDFVLANMSDDGRLCFGTSEFYISSTLVPENAQVTFGEHNTGLDMTLIGEAYDQSLWQAIAAGAYLPRARHPECALFVSPQWFFKGNGGQNRFSGKFSYELYRAFCANDLVDDDLHARVRARVEALGVDQALIAAANHDTPRDVTYDLAHHEKEQLRIRGQLHHLIKGAPTKSPVRQSGEWTGEPDWDALLEQGSADGAARCTNNDMGVYDDYWSRNSGYAAEREQNFDEAEDEWSDLALALEVIRSCGASCLVVLLPMHGAWYDKMGVTSDQRSGWYERARAAADSAGFPYADFSSCEYERYFFVDTVHPGWRGWPRIEKAFYRFVSGDDDEFLGGTGHGSVTGQGLEDMKGVES